MKFYCKITSGEYAKLLFSIFISEQWFWFVLPTVVCFVLCFIDLRFFILAMMILFIVIPMVMALVYFNYMLTLETRWSIVDKIVELNDMGINIIFDDHRVNSAYIPWTKISNAYVKGEYYLFKLSTRKYQYLVIPKNALIKEKQQAQFLSLLKKGMSFN